MKFPIVLKTFAPHKSSNPDLVTSIYHSAYKLALSDRWRSVNQRCIMKIMINPCLLLPDSSFAKTNVYYNVHFFCAKHYFILLNSWYKNMYHLFITASIQFEVTNYNKWMSLGWHISSLFAYEALRTVKNPLYKSYLHKRCNSSV